MLDKPQFLGLNTIGREDWRLIGGELIHNVHPRKDCKGPCMFHSPSDHHMVTWEQSFTSFGGDTMRMTRICSHGVFHTDPDSQISQEHRDCDGCCIPETEQAKMV